MTNTVSLLLIDDDFQLVKLLKPSLEEQGYTVYCAYDGRMGIEMAQRYRPNMILLDVNMPFVNGLKAFEKLRSDAKTAKIPVVFITEMTSQILYPIVSSSPKAAYLKKPLDLVDLNSFLRQFLQETAA